MHVGTREDETSGKAAPRSDGAPWAVALNETAATDEIRVTLLALAAIDAVIRVSGVVRVVGRPDVKLASVPTLVLGTIDGPQLGLVGAHVLPTRGMVWVSWIFERPADICTEYEGRIEQIGLTYRAGGVAQQVLAGPWIFTFSVPNESQTGDRLHRHVAVGEGDR
jgi:hypothetical protein